MFFPTVPSANTLVRWVNESAFVSIVQTRPCPPSADRFIFGVAPIDYGPVVLLMPFGFHLAMDTLPSEELTSFFGQRGITPAFGYGPPHPSARRTSTFLNNALLSTQYGAVRLLQSVRARLVALGLRGPASFPCGGEALQRSPGSRACCFSACAGSPTTPDRLLARVYRQAAVSPSSNQERVGVLVLRFSKFNSPAHRCPCLRFGRHLAMPPARLRAKMESLLLSCRTLSFPATCRFSPAHPD